MTDKNKPDGAETMVNVQNTLPQSPPTITTIQGLAAAYPALVEELRKMSCKLVADQTVEEFAKRFPDLYGRITKSLKPALGTNFGAVGFVLAADDSFGAGALRVYAKAAGYTGLALPAVLPYKDPATRTALESYIVRARGAGDEARVKAAEEALAKTKK
jgi:hypothetical protein